MNLPLIDYVKIILVYLAIFFVIIALYRLFSAIEFAKKNRNFLLALFSLLVFSLLRLTENIWLDYLVLNGTASVVSLSLQVLWWLALSFTANQFLDFFLWNGVLRRNGTLIIPILIKQTKSLFCV